MAPQRRQSDIKSRPILSALSFGMLLISLVNLIPTESLNLWRLSVLTTEFGHFFALFNIILIFVLWASVFDYLLLAINLIAIGIFLSPLFFALRSENQIKKIAALTLQKPPSLQELIHLPQVISKIVPKRISFIFLPTQPAKEISIWIFIEILKDLMLHLGFSSFMAVAGKAETQNSYQNSIGILPLTATRW
jgi:hypothetical protein